jgi:acyl carrier protein
LPLPSQDAPLFPTLPEKVHAMKDRSFIRATLVEILEADTGNTYRDLKEEDNLREGLGLDSVDVVSVISQIERRFHIRLTHEELEKLHTVRDVLTLLESKINAVPPAAAA